MDKCLISIVVPVFNTEQYIYRCVNSILEQTYKNIEIILIDDGSRDGSGIICDQLAEANDTITVIHKKNEGLGVARNTGIKNASGKYITFIDSDDYISVDHINNLINALVINKADACYGGHTKVNGNDEVRYLNALSGESFEGDALIKEIIPRMCGQTGSRDDCIQMSVCMAMYSLDLIRREGIRFVSERQFVSEDLIFNLDYISHSKKVCFSSDTGYFYWFNDTSLSHSYLPDRFEKSKVMLHEVSSKTKELGIYDECEQRIINSLLVNTRVSLQSEQKQSHIVGIRKTYRKFSSIIKDEELHGIMSRYNSDGVRVQARIVNYFIFHRVPILVWIIMALRNKMDI